MLTVKFMKYTSPEKSAVEQILVVSAKSVAIEYERELRTIVKTEAPQGEWIEVSVGEDGCAWHRAYVMNELGRTVETIR